MLRPYKGAPAFLQVTVAPRRFVRKRYLQFDYACAHRPARYQSLC